METLEAILKSEDCTAQQICAELALIFYVRPSEVALLRLQGSYLKFIAPPELRGAGSIPLSSTAVAARTAVNKNAEIFNNFVKAKHASIFEMARLGTSEGGTGMDAQTIQKLMSAAIVDAQGKVLGVLQISRKGSTRAMAGPDFTNADLAKLKKVAATLSSVIPKLAEDDQAS